MEELGITAGLQDRVIQVYGGTVFMDFSESLMSSRGYGEYSYLDSSLLPPLFLAYLRQGTESGKVHSDVRYRYQSGDPEVHAAMTEFARYAVEAREALLTRDYGTFGRLFNQNFDLRRRIFGDKALGALNLEMIDIARSLGCPAKFSGSNGAIVGIYSDVAQLSALEDAYSQRGYGFTVLNVERREEEILSEEVI
jgi:glucuronokinase